MADVGAQASGWLALVDRFVPATLPADPIERRRARMVVFNTSVFFGYGSSRAR